jgi:hypothetical protein
VRERLVLVGLLAVNLVACASPRENAYRSALNDYKHKNAVVVDFARVKVKQLVTATKAFQASVGHWPQTFKELTEFTFANGMPLDPIDFNDVTFAALEDGSVQAHYDINCSRFNDPQYSFTQTGTVNVKAKPLPLR